MALDAFIEKIPEGDREAFKAELAKVVFVEDVAQAKEVLLKHPVFSSARDSFVTEAVKTYDKNFNETKLKGLVEAKYKELHPDADPKDLAYKALEERATKLEMSILLERRKADETKKLANLGLPVELADLVIDSNDEQYQKKSDLVAAVKTWHEAEVAKVKGEILGNQGKPKAGATGQADFSKMSQTEVMAYARKGPAEEAEVTAWLKQRK